MVVEEKPSAKQERLIGRLNTISFMMPKRPRTMVLPRRSIVSQADLQPNALRNNIRVRFFRPGLSVVPKLSARK